MATAAKAVAKWIRIAPRKARIAANLVRGKKVAQALSELRFSRTHGAFQVRKVLESALANAQRRGDLDVDELVVSTIYVDEGPTVRRFLPRAMGRATRIDKRSSHITVELKEAE